ncbi:hypothetical protein [Propionispira raffinosivorans]|uniref:hypothetical protein n=1 Tax=Propionispira raffinosivorans TaxID=86959 RepID=UPI00035FFE86|nr:hypothetical protein [Propionispira raffinosivorans]
MNTPKQTARNHIKQLYEDITNYPYKDCCINWNQSTLFFYNELIRYVRKYSKFQDIITTSDIIDIKLDILTVDKISDAKTTEIKRRNLQDFSMSLDIDGPVMFETELDFQNNTKHLNERVVRWNASIQTWNNEVCIHNYDGAHHLAAVYRQCFEQGRKYYLNTSFCFESIDYSYLNQLLENYYLIYSDEENIKAIQEFYQMAFGYYNCADKIICNDISCISHPILWLRKDFELNKKIVEELCKNKEKFINLNAEIEKLYLFKI